VYQRFIREEVARQGHIGIDPRHIEAYMRLGHSTLDGLSRRQFIDEVQIGVQCILSDGVANAESLAKSYGL
jgi:hypothetical protein